MAKPTKHYDKWRIRWIDENGKRQSEVFEDFKTASYELKKREAEIEEIKQGRRAPAPTNKTFNEICDYWLEKRLPQKRSQKDDQSIIRTHLRPAFGHLKLKDISSYLSGQSACPTSRPIGSFSSAISISKFNKKILVVVIRP